MPILAKGTSMFPDDLLDSPSPQTHISSEDRDWYVLHTRSRQEKALARELVESRTPFYLPLIPSDRLVRGRRIRSFLPLFPGYVFFYGTQGERATTLKSNRIATTVDVADPTQLVQDLRQIMSLIKSDAPLSVERRLRPGQRARIKTGPFRDFEGTIVRRHGRQHLIVTVDFLNQGISVELDDVALQPA